MSKTEALSHALLLALTAPDNKLCDAVELAESFAALCTYAEIEEAKRYALVCYREVYSYDGAL